jgi:hypothetical protein
LYFVTRKLSVSLCVFRATSPGTKDNLLSGSGGSGDGGSSGGSFTGGWQF